MSKELKKSISDDLNLLLEWVKGTGAETAHLYQESIFNIIRLLRNQKFRKEIVRLREKYEVPKHFYALGGRSINKAGEIGYWLENEAVGAPVVPYEKDISDICEKFHLNPLTYGGFVIDYLYYGEVTPLRPYLHTSVYISEEDFRHKATLELDCNGSGFSQYPTVGRIKFFRNTTKNGLKRFINRNWEQIKKIQRHLQLYPNPKNYRNLKRDAEIYILHLLGNKAPEIANILEGWAKGIESQRESDLYCLEDTNIRQVIKDINKLLSIKLNDKV